MQTRGSVNFRIAVLFISIGMLCVGCLIAPLPLPQETATPVLEEESIISARIQSALNDYNTGLQDNNKTLSLSAIDERNLVILEEFSASFDDMQRSGFPKTVKLGMTVVDIEQQNQELTLAHIKRDRDDWRADWFFRKKDSKWVISEPTIAEAGTPEMTTFGHYTFITYPIAKNANEKIILLISKAEDHVRQDLSEAPTGKVQVTVYPTVSISPLRLGALSTWNISPLEDGTDSISIVAPASWWFGFYDPQVGWESDIEMLLTHELARIVYVRNFGNPGQGADWFFEGLAEYVAGYDEMADVIAAVQNDAVIPIIDTASSARKVDLAHFANLDNRFLAYGLSESLVTFIVENYGGIETFWKLARSYDQSQDMDKALQDTLGTSYEEFDANWRKWLKEEYIKR
jgi:hypothetical protein